MCVLFHPLSVERNTTVEASLMVDTVANNPHILPKIRTTLFAKDTLPYFANAKDWEALLLRGDPYYSTASQSVRSCRLLCNL